MKQRIKRLSVGGALVVALTACGQPSASDFNEQANDLYNQGIYGQALQSYKEAVLLAPDHPVPRANLGNARYELGDYPGAIEAPKNVRDTAPPEIQAVIFYNQGNAHFRLGELDDAIAMYKEALRRAPNDQDAKYNLELAQKLQQQQQQQQQQAQGGGGEQDPQQPPQGGGEQDPQQPPQGGGEQDPQQGNDDQRQPPPPSNMSPEDAQRALERLRRSEQGDAEDLYDNYAIGDPNGDNEGNTPSDNGW